MKKDLISKLALGTVQFGLDYGISNKNGKISKEESSAILDYALAEGIELLDTASGYGDSETIIGSYSKRADFQIVTKIPGNVESVNEEFKSSLSRLSLNNIYGYMYHDFNSFLANQESLKVLNNLKEKGLLQKIGFSVYYPNQIEYLLENNVKFDIIQLPYNLLDRRFEVLFSKLKSLNVEIHVRSVFLQGLFFKDYRKLHPFFRKITDAIKSLQDISSARNIQIASLCLNFCMSNEYIDKVIVGVDNVGNLKDNVKFLDDLSEVVSIKHELDVLKSDEEEILLPFNWKL